MRAADYLIQVPLAIMLVFVLPAAVAGQAPACDPRTFHEMYRCAVARYERANAEQKRAYEETAAKLEPLPRDELKKAQDAWLRYRQAQCAFESSKSAGRREYQVVRLRCMAELAEERTSVLRGSG